MIIQLENILEEVYEKYPLIKESSIDNICKKGLKGINRVMRNGDELFLHGSNGEELKFFIPLTIEDQAELMTHRYHIHKAREND